MQGRNWAIRRREISPADSSTFKCEEIVGCVSEKWPTRSDTDASPRARSTTIPRRVGSERAAKAWSSCVMSIDYRLYRWLSMQWRSSFAIADVGPVNHTFDEAVRLVAEDLRYAYTLIRVTLAGRETFADCASNMK